MGVDPGMPFLTEGADDWDGATGVIATMADRKDLGAAGVGTATPEASGTRASPPV